MGGASTFGVARSRRDGQRFRVRLRENTSVPVSTARRYGLYREDASTGKDSSRKMYWCVNSHRYASCTCCTVNSAPCFTFNRSLTTTSVAVSTARRCFGSSHHRQKTRRFLSAPPDNASLPVSTATKHVASSQHRQKTHPLPSATPDNATERLPSAPLENA